MKKHFHNDRQLSLFDWLLVDQELIDQELIDRDLTVKKKKIAPVKQVIARPVVSTEERIEWSEENIHDLRVGMLLSAIQDIRDKRKSNAMREEAWNWVFEDKDKDTPFSAWNCAKYTGYDIEELRRLLLSLVPSL